MEPGWVVEGAVAPEIYQAVVDMVQNRMNPKKMLWDQPEATEELGLVSIWPHQSAHLSSAARAVLVVAVVSMAQQSVA